MSTRPDIEALIAKRFPVPKYGFVDSVDAATWAAERAAEMDWAMTATDEALAEWAKLPPVVFPNGRPFYPSDIRIIR